ncbi:acyl-CoA dehydrogenase family protein [Picrophilus oshimae]|uniref:Acyl-CoA dehydrogenase n=1 Tax=Picrophilus torridus (strain ATCC 700027 / DSM 9790 / JCM 10055 / NBRC 100828 / KAW 2/3) TaxID=1122961 RepID=A0A8G2FVM2_PICTO|nr:acyl-CoA dehydrogenase family protein [Picrophilus oshimae]SMD30274.1 acyl-CoA dehydrogenase [Picrophilus oshimae DSM 9789]
MDFSFTEEDLEIRKNVSEFLQRELGPISKNIDNSGIPHDFILKAASQGIIAPVVSSKYNGSNLTFLQSAIIAEEISKVDTSMATSVYFLLDNAWPYIIEKYGNDSIKDELLYDVTSGKKFIGVASTEPSGGSDVAGIKTSGRVEKNRVIINGQKMYISGGMEAYKYGGGHLTLFRTSGTGHSGITMAYVPASALKIEKIENMGRMGISTCIMYYENTEIPDYYIIGDMNRGFYYSMDGFNHARIAVAAACNGLSEKILDLGIDYIKNRSAFGKKLMDFQSISFEAAELRTELEMTKLLTYKAAYLADKNSDELPVYSAMAKLRAPQLALKILKSVMMWYGAYGYTKDAGLERAARGIYSYLVGAEGALNIMKLIISKRIFS